MLMFHEDVWKTCYILMEISKQLTYKVLRAAKNTKVYPTNRVKRIHDRYFIEMQGSFKMNGEIIFKQNSASSWYVEYNKFNIL